MFMFPKQTAGEVAPKGDTTGTPTVLTLDLQDKPNGLLQKVVINNSGAMEMVTQDEGHVSLPLAGADGLTQFVYPNSPTNAVPKPVKAYSNTVALATAAKATPVVKKAAAAAPAATSTSTST